MKRLFVPGLMLSLLSGVAGAAEDPSLLAQGVMDQMIATYTSCSSYVDEGEVRTVFLETEGNRTVVKPFSTAFARPRDFRFEFKERRGEEEWNRYIVWRGDSVKTWWSLQPGVESQEDLSMALAGATGVSSGSAAMVPGLLIPELEINYLLSLTELKLVGEESVNGSDAYKVEGANRVKEPVTLWIDKQSLLLVKLFQRAKFDRFATETTMTYKPQVNVEIAPEKLAFNPPEKGR